MTHAKISDLPGWPCPARVSDMQGLASSWGYIGVDAADRAVAYDELGRLWIQGATVPKARHLKEGHLAPGAILFGCESGLGIYIHPKSYQWLSTTSVIDHKPGEWLPITEVAASVPEWIALGAAVGG